jgi:acyl-CoA thioesterase FadM
MCKEVSAVQYRNPVRRNDVSAEQKRSHRNMVGLIHTPRTLFHIAKGLAKRRSDGASSSLGGFGQKNQYISEGRAGLFDTDYLMHMNNAAYLSHAEYARWELCAYNGILSSMYRDNVNFVVGGTAIRFRREVAPIFRKFQVHSFLAQLDERHLWIYHAFRYPPGGKDPGRIRAHAICQGIAIQGRNVLDPRIYLKDMVGIDPAVVDSLVNVGTDGANDTTEDDVFTAMMDKYLDLEAVFKTATTKDDEELAKKS